MVNISAFVIVKETDYHYVGKETFCFQSTGLKIVVGDGSGTPVKVGAMETVKVTYYFINFHSKCHSLMLSSLQRGLPSWTH